MFTIPEVELREGKEISVIKLNTVRQLKLPHLQFISKFVSCI
jgi:hypothetical protein